MKCDVLVITVDIEADRWGMTFNNDELQLTHGEYVRLLGLALAELSLNTSRTETGIEALNAKSLRDAGDIIVDLAIRRVDNVLAGKV